MGLLYIKGPIIELEEKRENISMYMFIYMYTHISYALRRRAAERARLAEPRYSFKMPFCLICKSLHLNRTQ